MGKGTCAELHPGDPDGTMAGQAAGDRHTTVYSHASLVTELGPAPCGASASQYSWYTSVRPPGQLGWFTPSLSVIWMPVAGLEALRYSMVVLASSWPSGRHGTAGSPDCSTCTAGDANSGVPAVHVTVGRTIAHGDVTSYDTGCGRGEEYA